MKSKKSSKRPCGCSSRGRHKSTCRNAKRSEVAHRASRPTPSQLEEDRSFFGTPLNEGVAEAGPTSDGESLSTPPVEAPHASATPSDIERRVALFVEFLERIGVQVGQAMVKAGIEDYPVEMNAKIHALLWGEAGRAMGWFESDTNKWIALGAAVTATGSMYAYPIYELKKKAKALEVGHEPFVKVMPSDDGRAHGSA